MAASMRESRRRDTADHHGLPLTPMHRCSSQAGQTSGTPQGNRRASRSPPGRLKRADSQPAMTSSSRCVQGEKTSFPWSNTLGTKAGCARDISPWRGIDNCAPRWSGPVRQLPGGAAKTGTTLGAATIVIVWIVTLNEQRFFASTRRGS